MFFRRNSPSLTEVVDRYLNAVKSLTLSNPRVYPVSRARPQEDCVWWGGEYIPLSEMTHSLAIGMTGAGKSLLTNIYLASVVRALRRGSNRRLVIFETKGDILPILEGLGVPYKLMNINDIRGYAWDIAADFQEYDKVIELAHILIPQRDGGENVFFQDAARHIVAGIMMSFIYRHGKYWGLHDVFNAALSPTQVLIKILEGYPRGGDVINSYFATKAEKTFDNIRMQIATQLLPLLLPAAHSQWAGDRKISLQEFRNTEGVLVISQDLTAREASNPLIRAMFRRLIDFINASEDIGPNERYPSRTFISLDEARFIGKLPGLLDALTFTRSKGCSVNIGVQGKDGFVTEYGEDGAEEILGSCGYITILKVRGKKTAQWCQSLFGTVEMAEIVQSTNYATGVNVTSTLQRYLQPEVLDSEFLSLPLPSKERGLTGFFLSPYEEDDDPKRHISGYELERLKPRQKRIPSQIPKPNHLKLPKPWTPEEHKRLVYGRTVKRVPPPPATGLPSPKIMFPELALEIRACLKEMVINDVWNEAYGFHQQILKSRGIE